MTSLLLPIIYLAFISLGLPDSVLGAAWPNMYGELGVSVSSAGIVSMVIAAGTVLSSLASGWLHSKLGTGKITAFSVLLTAVALFGFSVSDSFIKLCLFAIPYGIGAGSVDAVLNNYVAVHYQSRHMSWLHCMWGVGCSIGPVIMSYAITAGTWNDGYRTISIAQVVLTAILLFSLPLWKDAKPGGQDEKPHRRSSLKELLGIPGVKQVLACFFCYSTLEWTTGMWTASYCTFYRGIPAEQAAAWASLFYIGITVGRFICGFITFRVNDQNMIRLGQGFAAAGIIMTLLPFGKITLLTGLILIGLGCAPIYPSIIHETPANFGEENSQGIVGIQMASAYLGTTLMPPLFGFLAEHISFALYPYFLVIILLWMWVTSEKLHKLTLPQRERYCNAKR